MHVASDTPRPRRLRFILIAALISFCALACAQPRNSSSPRAELDAAVNAVKPALIRISVVSVDFQEGREVKQEGLGSGVIISADGYAVTNHHVAGRATLISCTLSDKSEVNADLVGTDPLTDIAVIRLRPEKPRKFPFARFGDSSMVRVGDQVLAMGSPLAFSQSVTRGIISNVQLVMPRIFGHSEMVLDGEDVGTMVKWIAHDAEIFPGNSGGPLVDMKGRVIGINEIKIGLSGAIPANLARDAAQQIIKFGSVRRSWLGVTIQPLLSSSPVDSGVLVSDVFSNGPAAKAGVRSGDIITSAGGKEVSAQYDEEMPGVNLALAGLPIGKEVSLALVRGGKKMKVKVTPTLRETANPLSQEFKEWGITACALTAVRAQELMQPNAKGVRVSSMRPGGPAGDAKPSLAVDDVITEVAGKPVNNLNALRVMTSELTAGGRTSVPATVKFRRKGDTYLTCVKLGVSKVNDPGLEIRKAWLPIKTQVLTSSVAEAIGLDGRSGVRIVQIYKDSLPRNVDLKVGDIITAIDDTPVAASRPEDVELFSAMVRQYKVGTTVELTVLRDGKERKAPVELMESPRLAREMRKYTDIDFDFTVRDVGFFDRTDQGWPANQHGVIVESVTEGGWASLAALAPGDLITEIQGKDIRNVEECEGMMRSIAATRPASVVFKVREGGYTQYLEVGPNYPKPQPSNSKTQQRH